MVSNDTGPMHISFCTKTPIICLFGPCSPEQYGINEYAHIIIEKSIVALVFMILKFLPVKEIIYA